jgi:hypothetical protein
LLNKEKEGIFASTEKNRLISLICAVSLRYKTSKKSPKAKKFYFDYLFFCFGTERDYAHEIDRDSPSTVNNRSSITVINPTVKQFYSTFK